MKNHFDFSKDFLQRKLAQQAKIDFKKFKSGQLDEVDWAKLTKAAGQLYESLRQLWKN